MPNEEKGLHAVKHPHILVFNIPLKQSAKGFYPITSNRMVKITLL